MAATPLTREDLAAFKEELFQELRDLINASSTKPGKWLRSYQVRDMLGISAGTLQNMRINGTLPFKKIRGLIFYNYNDIIRLMDDAQKK
ncbi:MAG TPA: hypothetical protein VM802_30345 [Chitinophaga sp.]|uniref:helix-turn-helix domain-containing protein n=1 Tax=Chitinophaga sp. TaxID=1869181 RepID=UPI002C4AE97F|nr:DNA-binding protein [Chitinophaga sp.]HVI49207.1 hypothetical protein [Chitinophaga sp.]